MRITVFIIVAVMFVGIALSQDHKAADSKKKLLAHYMSWYTSRPFSGYWGWHWTMNRYNPEAEADDGRKVASYYYPLIGPYDSGDPDALECHVLLMKFAGIDGIIIDWYGIEDFYDYAVINKNTRQVITQIEKARLEYAICYEDQSVKHMVNGGHVAEGEAVTHGQAVMRWLQENCFNSRAYVKVSDRPALFVFGPQYFSGSQWEQLFSVLDKRPFLYTLNQKCEGADGTFGWPPVAGTLTTPEQWRGYLTDLYARNKGICVGTVFPQFHDIYKEAEIHESYAFIDSQGTKTLKSTLDMALESDCEIIQIVTWNDYGEGTMIEPANETGYRFLEVIQQSMREKGGELFPYVAADLELPVMLYNLKNKHRHDRSVMEDLSKCSEYLFSGDLASARKILESYHQF